jgi:hypothetical protein
VFLSRSQSRTDNSVTHVAVDACIELIDARDSEPVTRATKPAPHAPDACTDSRYAAKNPRLDRSSFNPERRRSCRKAALAACCCSARRQRCPELGMPKWAPSSACPRERTYPALRDAGRGGRCQSQAAGLARAAAVTVQRTGPGPARVRTKQWWILSGRGRMGNSGHAGGKRRVRSSLGTGTAAS